MTTVEKLADFQALDPFFRIIEEGVAGLVDGEHFFDLWPRTSSSSTSLRSRATRAVWQGAKPWPSCIAPMAPRSFLIVATTWPFITTRSPELSFSSTPPEAQGRSPTLAQAGRCRPSYGRRRAKATTGAGRCGWYRSGGTACYSLQGGVGSPSSLSNPERRSRPPS